MATLEPHHRWDVDDDPRAETRGARPRRPDAPWLVAVVGVIAVVMLALTVGAVIEALAVLR